MTRYIGNAISSTWSVYLDVTFTSGYNYKQSKAYIEWGIYYNAKHEHTLKYDTAVVQVSGYSKTTGKGWSGDVTKSKGSVYKLGAGTYYFNRTKGDWTATIRVSIAHAGSGAKWKGESTVAHSYTIPKRTSYAITYDKNIPSGVTADVTNMPSSQTKYWSDTGESGYYLTLSSSVPELEDFVFANWKDANDNVFYPSGTYTANNSRTLYAQWSADHPPTISDIGGIEYGTKVSKDGNAIKGFSTIDLEISGIDIYTGRTFSSATLTVGNMSQTINSLSDGVGTFSISATESGTFTAMLTITDSSNCTSTYLVGDVTVIDPSWTRDVEFTSKPPSIASNGSPMLITMEVYNYTDSDWDSVTTTAQVTVTDSGWSFPYTFDEDHVDDATSASPNTSVRVTYIHYDVVQTPTRSAFFETSRNQNYSNGIYNTMFVSGVDPSVAPNYTSRVWWCDVNNPLYFPETNYAEVGSNDTAVMGLTKVGDYLAAVKQSKTTDTAIYLLYPTSFEEDTTYAVKQGVQGVGALSRYSFNILGDETLFLSPNGVMAIVPTQDEEHKVQNRSYFIDGKLLKEERLTDAYSFVFDGKYWLAVGGKCYVLDGNQRNSWGNDRTNLVYECYYLENVPANCFVKYDDRLVFSTDDEVCRVKGENDIDKFIDAYDINAEEREEVPVKAEWSTVFDDDGALHYYKTMQKKGNLVSILPTDVLFKIVEVDETTFNADKTLYYTFDGTKYINCTEESVYDADETYYVRARSATRIFVRKDDKEPIEIERSFSYSSEIPSEMYLKKKFKKYKRLQFIIRNEEAEDFGIDEIVKSYTLGNYAKK